MNYDEIGSFMRANEQSTLSFVEYDWNKSEMLRIEDVDIYSFIDENYHLDPELVYEYYGEEASLNLCLCPFIRFVIKDDEEEFGVLHIHKPYVTSGYQVVELKKKETHEGRIKSWLEQ